jgi:four helix bundle protein
VIVAGARDRSRDRDRTRDRGRLIVIVNAPVVVHRYRRDRSLRNATQRRLLVRLPKRGTSDLKDQLKRAAQSIPQNIAEGAGKFTRADKARFYTIARGSAVECAAHLDVLQIEEFLDEENYRAGTQLLERVVAMLTKMIDP